MAPTHQPRASKNSEGQRIISEKQQGGRSLYSPRSQTLIKELRELLEPYNYGEAEIHSLVKRCGYDDGRIQAAVSHILDDNAGHEHDSWATTATASEKKVRAQEAKERRLQKEKIQAEEYERLKEQRTKDYEEKQRRLKQEAERRKLEEDALRLRRPIMEADKNAQLVPPGGRSTACAWRRSDEGSEATGGGAGSEATGGVEAVDEVEEEEDNGRTAEVELDVEGDGEEEEEEEEEVDEEAAPEPAKASYHHHYQQQAVWRPVVHPTAPTPAPIAETPAVSVPATTAAAPAAAAATAEPSASHGWGQQPVQAAAPQLNAPAAATSPDNGSLDDCVIMPPSFVALAELYAECEVKFGSLHAYGGTGPAASSTQPAEVEAPQQEQQQTQQPMSSKYTMGSWAEEEADDPTEQFEERGAPRGPRGGGGASANAPWARQRGDGNQGSYGGDWGDGRRSGKGRGKGQRYEGSYEGGAAEEGRGEGKREGGKGGKKGSGRGSGKKGSGKSWRQDQREKGGK
mmetsp:Transcript_98884/g.247969  ORF Transcript_98884/g.247969 Transcript_98884/m.247969 type:complete len:515 (-) Transcript_98884:58-1602(-)|eukprot:CAMPEP_0115651730 /NCGR_PEP_ID=MMETSP0272-20121206/41703_1 /TAXON_ID=71861 /ORGANISM="Scrippsiella trochoidea, Strain CCMP3099" /LENGTH=514 /DNA_ID=CAMNT_0003089511 /DNA_START=102 /DNA_END=1646 /DNA_ORIENTATION=+